MRQTTTTKEAIMAIYELTVNFVELELDLWIKSEKEILLTKEAKEKGYTIKEIHIKENMPGIDIIVDSS